MTKKRSTTTTKKLFPPKMFIIGVRKVLKYTSTRVKLIQLFKILFPEKSKESEMRKETVNKDSSRKI